MVIWTWTWKKCELQHYIDDFIEKYTFSFQIHAKKDKVEAFPKPSISYKASILPTMHIKSIFFWIIQIVWYNSIRKFVT